MSDLTYKYFDKLHNLLNEEENDNMTTVSKEYKDNLQEKIDALQRELDSLKVEKQWYDSVDRLTLHNGDERIEVECNYTSWKRIKENLHGEDILMLDVYEGTEEYSASACTSITLDQMIQLRDYLTHKIEYLQL